MSRYDSDTDEAVVTESETRLKRPPLYQVLLHNDDFTTMEFVVYVLQNIFQRSETDAIRIMLQVHLEGSGVAGVYTYEVAEMKVAKVAELAEANEFPLLCTIEESAG
ncbi:MAG TPA: ATP-dependent Clp protease adapter ClpS [Pyrinomonadaceae bacterium]|nr:ATP-dependent Clp protease adapter ClpS [Pyrinomonadaceae bacterium]